MINDMRCFTWPFRPRYYLTHPWKWFQELGANIRAAYRRVHYGWNYSDAWNCDTWFLTVFPQLLRHIADFGSGYPGVAPYDTPDKWHDYLHTLAAELESLEESKWYAQNEYEEDFHRMSDLRRNSTKDVPRVGFVTVTYDTDAEFEVIKKKYFERTKELTELRQKKLEEALDHLKPAFFLLWD